MQQYFSKFLFLLLFHRYLSQLIFKFTSYLYLQKLILNHLQQCHPFYHLHTNVLYFIMVLFLIKHRLRTNHNHLGQRIHTNLLDDHFLKLFFLFNKYFNKLVQYKHHFFSTFIFCLQDLQDKYLNINYQIIHNQNYIKYKCSCFINILHIYQLYLQGKKYIQQYYFIRQNLYHIYQSINFIIQLKRNLQYMTSILFYWCMFDKKMHKLHRNFNYQQKILIHNY